MSGKHVELIPALDVLDLDVLENLARSLGRHPLIYGFKVGFSLGLSHGLPRVVETIRRHSDKAVIYDHQKAGTDIPATGPLFAQTLHQAGITEAILFPQAGAETLTAWAAALRERGLKVIVGGIMTHHGYLASEGGFLADDAVVRMYEHAINLGVKAFVTPLTRPDVVRSLTETLAFPADAAFYSPGLGAQGGDPLAFPFLKRHYLIAGRSLLQAPDPTAWVESQAALWRAAA